MDSIQFNIKITGTNLGKIPQTVYEDLLGQTIDIFTVTQAYEKSIDRKGYCVQKKSLEI